MAEPALDPVVAQPTTTPVQEKVVEGVVQESTNSWWGVTSFTSLLAQPHLLEQGMANVANQVAQATSGAGRMVKSKSMEVMKAVSSDLGEVKSTLSTYAGPVAGGVKNTIVELDEVTDEMAEAAITGVAKSASSFWNMASGYASQMFTEDDLEATPVLVGSNSEPIILDRLQAQLHALASDPATYTKDPHPSDGVSEDWTQYLASLDLDSRQGEISELMINNAPVRRHYSGLVPATVQHKLFWARYFFKVHLIDKQEVKRQVLKKRAEQTKVDSDSEINWDDEDDLECSDIPDAVQEKLLSDYEAELKCAPAPQHGPNHAKKDSSASDDWENLSNESK